MGEDMSERESRAMKVDGIFIVYFDGEPEYVLYRCTESNCSCHKQWEVLDEKFKSLKKLKIELEEPVSLLEADKIAGFFRDDSA
jgi:hypothetical protein